ncbi:hypothetical protein MTO96_047431 [Rhipicephalus appendiculatus]
MLNSAQLRRATEEPDEEEHSEPPPLYPPWQCPEPPLVISEEDKQLASDLAEQRRKFIESGFNVPPPKKPRLYWYCPEVVEPPRVNYDSSYFPDELKVSKKAKKNKRSSQTCVAQIDIEQELLALQDTDYVHNYYDDYEDDGAFNEDNLDDGVSY